MESTQHNKSNQQTINNQFDPFDLINCPLTGTNLIEASAGTGKTYTICALYIRLIIEKYRNVSDILVVTFTEAATEELRDRIRNMLHDFYVIYSNNLQKNLNNLTLPSEDPLIDQIMRHSPPDQKRVQCLELAIRNFDEAAIFTIHGFCNRILQEHAFESGVIFDAELLTDDSDLIQEIADDFFRHHFYEANPLFIRYAQKTGHTPEMMREWVQFVISKPFIQLTPEISCPDESSIQESEKQFYECFNQVKKVFEQDSSIIEKILLTDDSLDRRYYQQKSVKKWIKELALLFSESPVPGFPHQDLMRLSASNMSELTKKGHHPPTHPFFEYFESYVDAYKALDQLYEIKLVYIKQKWLKSAHAVLFDKKKRRQIQTFDDLLYYVHQAINNDHQSLLAESIRNKYHAALIDEFQDTDPIQYTIFNTIFNHPKTALFLIGDPKQAIYSFRGADLFAYLKSVDHADNRYTLSQNWRSSPMLLKAINTLFSNHPNTFVYKKMSYQNVSPALSDTPLCLGISKKPQIPFQILYMKSTDESGKKITKEHAQAEISETISNHIDQLLKLAGQNFAVIDDKAVQPGDIAILVRTNKEAKMIYRALQKKNIPGVVYSKETVWDSPICRDLAHVLRAVSDYQNDQLVKSALISSIIGMNADTLFEVIDHSNQWDEWIERFQRYHDIWRQKGFMVMFRFLLVKEKVRSRLLALENGERLLTDILHIAELLHQVDIEKKQGMSGLLESFNRYRAKEKHIKNEFNIRLETDENAVKIVTIHKSKGLQYKIVYCPFVSEKSRLKTKKPFLFHDPEANDTLTLPLTEKSRNDCLNMAEIEYLAENMRLLYVAVTRAQYQCYLVCGDINKSETSAVSWLLYGGQYLAEHSWTDDLVALFESYIQKMSKENVDMTLVEISEKSQGSIQYYFDDLPLPHVSKFNNLKTDSHLKVNKSIHLCSRTIQKTIDSNWRITSFSALTSNISHAAELPDHDAFLQNMPSIHQNTNKDPEPLTIFSFPKGARPGTFLHDLLEHLDFQENNPTILLPYIEEKLSAYGYDVSWTETLQKMVQNVTHARLSKDDPDFRLFNIQKDALIHELSFHFPISDVQPREISAIIETIPWVKRSKIPLYSLDFHMIKGMMKGFVDLIFVYKDRYYIVDWKSNYLGPTLKDYANLPMKRAILDHYYILQYYLYTVALHRYLNLRMINYEYNTHFGGVYYLFLRGLDDKHSGNYGIFRDYPEWEVIQSLDHFFNKGSHFFFEKTQFLRQQSFDF